MSDAPWHFDKREPSTAATVISEADILKASDTLAEFVRDCIYRDPEALRLVYAYEKARKGKR